MLIRLSCSDADGFIASTSIDGHVNVGRDSSSVVEQLVQARASVQDVIACSELVVPIQRVPGSEAPGGSRAHRRTTALEHASDADLGKALSAGDPEAGRVAWDRFLPMVKRVLRRALDRSVDVEDVAQTVFLCFFRRVHTLRDPNALRGFVISITIRVVREEVRRRRRLYYRMVDRGVDVDVIAVDANAPARHALATLSGLLERLRERERAALLLRFVAGMGVAEVAVALGVSEPTARRSVSTALKRISRWARNDRFLADYVSRPGLNESD